MAGVCTDRTVALARRRKMLVVDPEHGVESALKQLAIKEGWNFQEAPDNQAVLALVKASEFDLIITGEETSASEDLALLRKIRAVRPHIRMIILTKENTPGEIVGCLKDNAFSYFVAPIDTGRLCDFVHMALTEPCWDDGIEVISATKRWIRLLARCTIDTADRLVHFLRQSNLPEIERDELSVAAHELLLNAMEHGGRFDPNQYVEIGYLRTRRAVACRIKDPGTGFALDEIRHAAINSTPGDLFTHMAVREAQGIRPGGFGILLASEQVDEVIYGEKGNDVILIKYLDTIHSEPAVQLNAAASN
jgi:anti-sigma regulatory factor (Ser/Thr protein kinase)/ActR/RegA family two-component response regulator